MPTYEFKCVTCRKVSDGVFSIAQIPATIDCQFCHDSAHRIISASNFSIGHIEPYYDHGLGQVIHGKQHKLDVMKEQNVMEVEGGINSIKRHIAPSVFEEKAKHEKLLKEGSGYLNYLRDSTDLPLSVLDDTA